MLLAACFEKHVGGLYSNSITLPANPASPQVLKKQQYKHFRRWKISSMNRSSTNSYGKSDGSSQYRSSIINLNSKGW